MTTPAPTPLKIDFVSDIACPWCAVGLSALQAAIEQVGDLIDVGIVLHPFELNPMMAAEGETIVDYLGRKYGRSPEQIAQTQEMIRERGAAVGFHFGPRTHVYNTFDAHRLLYWAGFHDKQLALKIALLRAYHGEGKDPSDHDVLVHAARQVGLDAESARAVLTGNQYVDEVREDIRRYQAMGIDSVPAIIFDERYVINGGQPVETFVSAIRQIVAERASGASAIASA